MYQPKKIPRFRDFPAAGLSITQASNPRPAGQLRGFHRGSLRQKKLGTRCSDVAPRASEDCILPGKSEFPKIWLFSALRKQSFAGAPADLPCFQYIAGDSRAPAPGLFSARIARDIFPVDKAQSRV
jgi:hypothetical protein